jgi:proteic killer suppression protein
MRKTVLDFGSTSTESLFEGVCPKTFRSFRTQAERKLQILDSATEVQDLRSPPRNRLEKLRGERSEFWSIRINSQWRLCFEWRNGEALNVEIVDYH